MLSYGRAVMTDAVMTGMITTVRTDGADGRCGHDDVGYATAGPRTAHGRDA